MLYIFILLFLYADGFASEWECNFVGALEYKVAEYRMLNKSKEELVEAVNKLPGTPREHIMFHAVVSDVYELKNIETYTPDELMDRGKKICEGVK